MFADFVIRPFVSSITWWTCFCRYPRRYCRGDFRTYRLFTGRVSPTNLRPFEFPGGKRISDWFDCGGKSRALSRTVLFTRNVSVATGRRERAKRVRNNVQRGRRTITFDPYPARSSITILFISLYSVTTADRTRKHCYKNVVAFGLRRFAFIIDRARVMNKRTKPLQKYYTYYCARVLLLY